MLDIRFGATPFYLGKTAVPTRLPKETVRLGGQLYGIDLADYRFTSQETLRDGAVVQAESGDALFNANGAWSRYRYRWDGGADQELADFTDEAAEFRFDRSVGVDPWTVGQLTLLRSTTQVRSLPTGNNVMTVANGRLYVSDGTSLMYTADLSGWTTATAPGGTVQSMTTDGVDLYVATSSGVVRYANGAPGTPVAFGTPVTGDTQQIAFVANRLLIGQNNVLREVGASGATTPIMTHFQAGFRWTCIFAIGSRIYAGGYAGVRSELYTFVTDSTGLLVRGSEAAPLPTGELLQSAASSAGVVVLCTNRGARQASIGADSTLTYGPLIAALGSVRGVTFDGRFAWTTWSSHPSGGPGTARLALDVAVSPLQPAYASDVYAPIGATCTSVARFLNRTVFVVDGVGMYAESTTSYVSSGWVKSGRLFFGTVENKALTELRVGHAKLLPSETITASVMDDGGQLLGGFEQTVPSEINARLDLSGAQVRFAEVEVTLRGPTTSTPTVFFWRLRAWPVPPAVFQWIVPLRLFSRFTTNGDTGQQASLDPLLEMERIRGWYERRESLLYQEGDRLHRVRVDAFEMAPARWTDNGLYYENICRVRLVSA
jgi:hypothetical protein